MQTARSWHRLPAGAKSGKMPVPRPGGTPIEEISMLAGKAIYLLALVPIAGIALKCGYC